VGRAIELLAATGVLVETTGKKRDRSFVYGAPNHYLIIDTSRL